MKMSDRGPWPPGALCQLPKWLMALDVGPQILYIRLMSNNTDRFELIMAMVDAWAEIHHGWDCRVEAEAEVAFILGDEEYADWTDKRIAEPAIAAWMAAE